MKKSLPLYLLLNPKNNYFIILLSAILIIFAKPINADNTQDKLLLDGKSFAGSIKAKGIIGLVSVKGTLSFQNGWLIWAAKDSKDKGKYEILADQGTIKFSAILTIEMNEQVEWSGVYDGRSLYNVKAVWKRNKGDFFHDLLLPEVVTLVFTPKE